MVLLKLDYFFRAIDVIVYLTMHGLAFYLIYQGEVFQKFQEKKTNFAVYTEKIVELPTMNTYIYPLIDSIRYQKDFNLSLRAINTNQEINLTLGENVFPGTNIRVKFDILPVPNELRFKIIPLHFKRETPHDLLLVYRFRKNLHFPTSHHFWMELSTENNSMPCGDLSFFDGAVESATIDFGSHLYMTLHPEKYIYHQDNVECRKNSYLEEITTIVEKELFSKCNQPCRPDSDQMWASCWGLSLSEEIRRLPLCKEKNDIKCYIDVVHKAKEKVEEQPCTKLQYKINTSHWKGQKNEAAFEMRFVIPRKVSVHEKYLLYDLGATIGAIGGTLGLCIGISFYDIARVLSRSMEELIKKIQTSDGSLHIRAEDIRVGLNAKQLEKHEKSLTKLDTLMNIDIKMTAKLENKA